MPDAVEQFAIEAERFARWAEAGTDTGSAGVRNALVRLTTLYLRALDLPNEGPGDDEGINACRVEDAEWQPVYEHAARIPVDYYGVVLDSTQLPPSESGIGSVSDDIADIYRDVVLGVRLFQAGRRATAVWHWNFSLTTHWGRHVMTALPALHAWLAEHEPWAFRG